jgi:hypothetical protein
MLPLLEILKGYHFGDNCFLETRRKPDKLTVEERIDDEKNQGLSIDFSQEKKVLCSSSQRKKILKMF